jgi:carbamoyltransferase
MYVLGFNSGIIGHDSAACLIKNGKIIAAAEEERFTREKHSGKFPINAIRYCCKEAGISPNQIDHWAYYWDRKLMLKRYINVLPYLSFGSGLNYIFTMQLFAYKDFKKALKEDMQKFFGVNINSGKFHFVPHHLAHASSAYHLSGFKDSAILTIDGFGEWESSLLAYGKGLKIKKLEEIGLPTSIGILYSNMTAFVGFRPNSGEYKVMGLAPYGRPKYYAFFRSLFKFKANGKYTMDSRLYTQMHHRNSFNGQFPKFITDVLGKPRNPETEITQRDKDVAASLQKITEDCMLHSARYLYDKTQSKNLCMAGGVALNSVANARIKKELPFENIFVQPAAHDAGCSIGAATYTYVKEAEKTMEPLEHIYLGPEFTDKDVEDTLKKYELKYVREPNIEKKAAQLMADGKIGGWFQGRMEFGPRALGSRSIIADPRRPDMKDKVNEAVKLREGFRPFAPSLLEEYQDDYLDMYGLKNSPYMLFVLPVKENKRAKLPAITHFDGTARPQTVNKKTSPKYWKVIDEFRKITGEAIILNTSFNVRGEPIVHTPEDAIRCFLDTDIDFLVLHDFLVTEKNLKKRVNYARKLSD